MSEDTIELPVFGLTLGHAGDGWTCCVEQGHYGHPARKATWLYAVGCELPELVWGACSGKMRMDDGYHSAEDRARRAPTAPKLTRLTKAQRIETPIAFRDLLLAMARTVKP